MKWTKDSGRTPPASPAVRRVVDDARKHGRRLPPGQVVTEKWPVLHYGQIPRIQLADWRFNIRGLVEAPVEFTFDEFRALPNTTVRNDIHCVTHWSRFDNTWDGVRAADVLARVSLGPGARYAMVHAYGGYTTNIPLEVLMRPDAIFAFKHDGHPLSEEHGWPCRLVVPEQHYFWKSAKWVNGLELLAEDRPGFWEQNGYHMNGNPFDEERYGG